MKRLTKQELEEFANKIKDIYKGTSTLQPHEQHRACREALWELEGLKAKKFNSRRFRRQLRIEK